MESDDEITFAGMILSPLINHVFLRSFKFYLSLLFLNIILTRSKNGLLFDIDKWSFTKKYYRPRLHLIVRLCYRMICELRESVSIEERGHFIQLHWQKFRICIVY